MATTTSPTPALEVSELRAAYGKEIAVRGISFTVMPGEFVTLLGPSGCGKTTTLRCIAGLEVPVGGSIRINGAEVNGPNRFVPPQKRGINMVFQSYAIWPHMTVEQNVSYGLRGRKLPGTEVAERTAAALEMVGLTGFAKRYGTELSGGQQQRVALARAVVTNPELILFDEPLSNLDAGLRERMRDELLALQRRIGKTAIYVTHDQGEAMAMSDRVILMNKGDIEQAATPRDLYNRPPTRFAASFIGTTNLIEGRVTTIDGRPVFQATTGALTVEVGSGTADGLYVLAFRPEHVRLGGDVNPVHADVVTSSFLGNRCDVTVDVGGTAVRLEAPADFDHAPGEKIQISLPTQSLRLYDDAPRSTAGTSGLTA